MKNNDTLLKVFLPDLVGNPLMLIYKTVYAYIGIYFTQSKQQNLTQKYF